MKGGEGMRRYETASGIGPGSESRMKLAEEVQKRTKIIKQINKALKKSK